MEFRDKRALITGGTGSLGKAVVRRLLNGEMGLPSKIVVFSRDEAKQHYMRLAYLHRQVATDEIIYDNFLRLLSFRIGDVRDMASVTQALQEADIVVHAAAMKQVPTCEYFPFEAVMTNVVGGQNIVRSICENRFPIEVVVGVSTDKACKPVNVMGMTKAIQERILIQGNMECPNTRFVCARYGNVIASRGSVIPLFQSQIERGGPVTITSREMTRFLLTLDQAVDTIFATVRHSEPGDTYVPKIPSALVADIAEAMIDGRDIPIEVVGIRPGEKVHEILVSEEECVRTTERHGYYAIRPILGELRPEPESVRPLAGEYSSARITLDKARLRVLLASYIRQPAAMAASV